MSLINSTYLILGFIALLSSLIVVSALNPVHRVALLIVVFMAGSFMYTLLDYYFLGLTYIIVYVGAIAILFLFVIMMVQIEPRVYNQIGELAIDQNDLSTSPTLSANILNDIDKGRNTKDLDLNSTNWGKTVSIGIIFILSTALLFVFSNISDPFALIPYYANWAIEYKMMTDIQTLANVIYVAYPLSIVLIGVTLWAVMIGVIVITGNDNSLG